MVLRVRQETDFATAVIPLVAVVTYIDWAAALEDMTAPLGLQKWVAPPTVPKRKWER